MFGLTFTLVAVALATIYFYVKYLYSYWQRRGIPYVKPSFPLGNFSKTFLKKLPMFMQLDELYRSTSEPFIGIFLLQIPFLLIRDPELIRSILITDFQYFTDRRFYLNEKDEPLTAHLGALRDQRWRDMRAILTPAFTSHKMKMIFAACLECGNQLHRHLSKVADTNEAIEMCGVLTCYTLSVMASTIYGIDIDCLANPNHPFRIAERKVFAINLKNGLRFIGWVFQHKLLKWSGLRFVDRDVEEYFVNLVAQTLEMREQKNIVRNDLFQLLVELLRNDDTSSSIDRNEWETAAAHNPTNRQKSLTLEQIATQTFALLLASVEPTSLLTSYCLYEIAKHPEIQRKLHSEIDHVMAQLDGQLTYESINELKYMDCCIDETFRKYQFLDLSRVCVRDYKIPGTNVTIEKGTSIIISPSALHYDEKFFPDPEKFNPSRFNSGNWVGKSLIDTPYLPFGDGPRACIGKRMGKMLIKICVCSILQQYHVELDDQHIGKKIQISLNLQPIGGIHIKLKAKNTIL